MNRTLTPQYVPFWKIAMPLVPHPGATSLNRFVNGDRITDIVGAVEPSSGAIHGRDTLTIAAEFVDVKD